MSSSHEILILGGHHAGINVAHYLLRHVIPKLTDLTSVSYHVTIVTPNVDFYWNIACPRLLVSENMIPFDKVFLPIAPAFASYPASQFTHVVGKAVAIDSTKQTSVLIAGGGPIGVETAGEIGAQYRLHDTTILSGTSRLLPKLVAGNGSSAESRLKALGVKTIHNIKVSSSKENPDGTTSVALSDGSLRKVDVFIDATGGKPNSSFLPRAWLNGHGYVVNDDKTLRTPIPGVYAAGDIGTASGGTSVDAFGNVAPRPGKKGVFVQKEFKTMKTSQVVPVGASGGVGQVFGWRVPSLLVWAVKSRTFMVSLAKGDVEGDNFKKA
ncbi:hypothetical protein DL95DRAFT_439376 [Leptodontidium sp. 2 PMI_412]|nr:hypothetical protein DL95DRAFT_439376 [Leptodontidium sp. 2 PMI_412]